MAIGTIAVIGAGQMGSGIAQVCAAAGYAVRLSDVAQAALDAARPRIERNLERQRDRGRLSAEDAQAALGRIETATGLAGAGAAELVIEAATEDESVKRAIFADLEPHLADETIVATNTSSLSITRLAAGLSRPERFMGVHFMNPVPKMPLVELVRGLATSEATYAACRDVVERLGKTQATAEDAPGFMVNRVLVPMVNEAVFALQEGVGSVAAIDTAMTLGASHPMGPLQLADLIGLDTCLAIMETLQGELGDDKYRPCPLLRKYVAGGWLGRKSGRGFYDYTGETPVPTR